MAPRPPVSLIINTDARAASLADTLASLQRLDYAPFEVCVVCGPTPDGTRELVEGWRPRVKIAHCPARNLSQSRNIGLALAAGEIVAFLDDDAILSPQWLSRITRAFVRPEVAACGGFVHDSQGVGYEWRFGTIDRLGRPDRAWQRAPLDCNYPLVANLPALAGSNCALRISALAAVGGFDETYEYYLDETDLICRLVDAGWHIVPVHGAAVYHKCAPSPVRSGRLMLSWYTIVRSKIYFAVVNGLHHHRLDAVLAEASLFVEEFRRQLAWAIAEGLAPASAGARFEEEVDRGWREGLSLGLAGERRLRTAAQLRADVPPFLPYERDARADRAAPLSSMPHPGPA